MLQIETKSNRNAPKFFCNSCGREITDAKNAAVIYANFADTGSKATPLFVHKNFVHGDCMTQAEQQLKAQGQSVGWEELTTLLAHLIANVGMDADAVRAILAHPDY